MVGTRRRPGHDGTPGDLITGYLVQLGAGLHVPRRQAELILAEAEDHLRETAAAGIAAGLTEPAAQQAAISSFGAVRAALDAVNQLTVSVLGIVLLTAYRLGRRLQGRYAPERTLLAGFFPAVAVSFLGALGLVVIALTWDQELPSGGIFFAAAFLALAACYSARMVQALLRRD